MIRSIRKLPTAKEAAVRGKQLAWSAAVALAVVVSYDWFKTRNGKA